MSPHRSSRFLFPALFAIVAGAIFAGAHFHFLTLKTRQQQDDFVKLAAIADQKTQQVSHWLVRQRGYAEAVSADRILAREVRNGLTRDLRVYLAALRQHNDYRAILLLDLRGTVLLSIGEEARPLDQTTRQLAAETVACGCVVFSDFQRDEEQSYDGTPPKVHLDLLAPLKVLIYGKERVIGVLVLRIDPRTRLYPLLQSWPTPSASAETLLVRAQGQDVVFLNELRHQKDTALSLLMPLESTDLPASLVAHGKQGGVAGTDYRGVPVLADLRAVPETSWSMMVKVDAQELAAPLAESRRMLLSAALLLSALAGGIVFLLWLQYRGSAHQHDLFQAERAEVDRRMESYMLSVSRELRTPLHQVDAEAQGLQDAWAERLDDESRQPLNRIRAGVRVMDRRLDDLLAFSRLSGAPLNLETVSMADQFKTAFEALRATDPGRHVRWDLRPMPSAQADRLLIQEVVRHLLANAFKFTRGRKTAKLEAGALPAYMGRDGYRTFFLRDNGVGFDMRHAERLFGIFQRLHDDPAFDGSGVGLAVVRQIVERHGGQIWAQSFPDDGAVFFFSLPSREK